MKNSIIIELLQNTAILLAFAMLYENFWIKDDNYKSLVKKILIGLILSGIGVVLMFTPWSWVPGIVFDTRSVMISVSGLFFGPIPTIITMFITSTVRLIIGGDGQWMGIAVIISSGTIGLLWKRLRPDWKSNNYYLELLVMGILVHITMSLCTFLLPSDKILPTLRAIALPLIFIYSPTTMLLGIIMLKQYKNTQNRLAQLKLDESERRLAEVLESGNIVSLLLNKDGIIKYCNNYLLQITGYTQNEVLEKNWFEIFIPKELKDEMHQNFFNSIHSGNIVKDYENLILSKSGEQFHISWYNTVFHSNSNVIIGVASIGVNITKRKVYEKKLEEKNNEYKQINEKLLEAKEKAEESERLKSAFLQNMSHEIRTPLNAISGFSGMLNKPGLSEEKRKSFVSIVQNSSQQLISIITDILTISSLETKQEKANINKVCINNIIVDLLSIFKQQAQNQNISLYAKQQLNEKQSEIYTDRTKITQILTNLLTNALKFTHEGFIEFGYNLNDSELEFYVKDSGIGIKPEFHEKIFERFRQADKSINKLYGGTGLGLAISKAFVELLGGKIWVQSELEKGSTFYFTIPYKPVNEIYKTITPTKQNENFKTILVAEDEEYNFLFIEELLIDLDLKLIHSKDGKETIEIYKSNANIDLILMDIKMPIMTGYEAAKIIKELKPDLPIVAQSAYALEHDRVKYEGIFDDYLTKPINENDLKQIVMKYIDI